MRQPDFDRTNIPQNLLDQYGEAALKAAFDAIFWKRQEIAYNNQPARRPSQPFEIQPPADHRQPPTTNQQNTKTTSQTACVKIWPSVILAGFQFNHGGAARLYFLARSLDHDGRGWISADDLVNHLRSLAVGERKRRRWISDAVKLGLFVERIFKKNGSRVYFLAGLNRAALALGSERIGRPATVDAQNLVATGWRALVWSAYLTTLNDRPISQSKKAELTGVSERTQRNYQANQPGGKIKNYADRGRAARGRLDGMRENCEFHAFEHKGRIIQKLPDIRTVPDFVSCRMPRGRSRKAQAALNDSLSRVRQAESSSGSVRLFCEGAKQTKSTLRRLAHSDAPLWERPLEIFEHIDNRRNVNRWRVVPVCEVVA